MKSGRWWWWLVALAAVAVVAWALRHRVSAQSRAGRAPSPQERAVPVQVARVERRDVPLYLEGLGTATAWYTVTVRAQVEGRLDAVAFREGQAVHRGDLLARIDPRPFEIQLRQAEAVAARDRAQLEVNRRTLARTRELVAQRFVAQQDLDAALGAVATSEAALRGDEAQVASARLNLAYTRITSPIDGVTGLRQVDPGNLVRAGDAAGLVVVTQVDPIAVIFTLPEDDLPRVAARMAQGALPVEVFSRDGETRLGVGELAVIDNQINASTATVRLKAVLPNPDRRLWPEQFVKARLLVETRRGALVVPAAAVQRGPQGAFAYVVGADQRVAARPVQVDRVEAELALVTGGLAEGESVVVEGQSRLRAGARVQARGRGTSR